MRVRDDGIAELQFPFDRYLVETLKTQIHAQYRSYDPETKTWLVDSPYVDVALRLLRSVFPDAELSDERTDQRRQARPEPIRSTDATYAALHLLPSAPTELVEVAYRTLAKRCHPDRLPETERAQANQRMTEINAAVETLRARGAA